MDDRLMTEQELKEHLDQVNKANLNNKKQVTSEFMQYSVEAAKVVFRVYAAMLALKPTIKNIVAYKAEMDKTYLDALIAQGFTRKEALTLIGSNDLLSKVM